MVSATRIIFGQHAMLDGEWWGMIRIAGQPHRVRLMIDGDTGTLSEVDQDDVAHALDIMRVDGDVLSFGVDSLGVHYRGVVQDGAIHGEYSLSGVALDLVFGRAPLAYPSPVALDGEPNPGFDGQWFGLLGDTVQGLRLRLEIEGEALVLYSVDQGDLPIPAEIAAIDGDRIFFRIGVIDISYLGRLADGRIDGELTQAGATQPLLFQRTSAAADPAPPLTQARLQTLLAQSGAPGLTAAAVAVPSKARPVLNLIAGRRRADAETNISPSDLWHLGSITKSMTATLVARLAEAGRLSWDDTIGAVLGAALPDMRAEYRDISFRHLCSHTAGLIRDLAPDRAAQFPAHSADVRADRMAAARLTLSAEPLAPRPGQVSLYSNLGYVVTGAMLETIMGARWEDLLAEHVFAPLRMAETSSAPVGAPGQPAGHVLDPRSGELIVLPTPSQGADIPDYVAPGGRVRAPLEDALRYLTAHLTRDPFLRPRSWDILHTPPFGGDYAMGWIVRPDGLWHNGSIGSWYAEMLFDPARGVAAIAAANLGMMARGVNAATASALAGAAAAAEAAA